MAGSPEVDRKNNYLPTHLIEIVMDNIKTVALDFHQAIQQVYDAKKIPGTLRQCLRGARFLSYAIRLQNPMDLDPAIKLADNLALASGSANVMAQRDGRYIRYDFEVMESFWKHYTRRDVVGLQLGLASGGQPVSFSWEFDYHHLFAGATGSGKSTTIRGLICGIADVYKPDEVQLFICDPHGDYGDFDGLAHLGARIETENAGILSLISHVYQIYLDRKNRNSRSEKPIVLVIDESQDPMALGNSDPAVGFNEAQVSMVAEMARAAGKYQVRLVIGSQKPNEKDLPGIVANVTGRWVGRVMRAYISTMITGVAGVDAQRLSGKGDFLHITQRGQAIRFQAAMPTPATMRQLPRASVGRIGDVPLPEGLVEPQRGPGRPAEPLDPKHVAWMLSNYQAGWPGRRVAGQAGITRHMHTRLKEYCDEIVAEMRRIKKESKDAKE